MADVLSLNSVGYALGAQALVREVTARVAARERIAILGANGAGKSTLLRLAHQLIAPTSGTVSGVPTAQQAMLFQRPPMLRASVLDNVRFALRATHACAAADIPARANEALAACELTTLAQRQARSLSGGEQQRLALACVWARKPALLFADEPTASLDRNAVRDVESLLLRLNAQGTALILTTHSLGQAKRVSERVWFLHDGALTDDVATPQFFAHQHSAEAKQFLEGESM